MRIAALLILALTTILAQSVRADEDTKAPNLPAAIITPSPYPTGFFENLRENFYSSVYSGADGLATSLFDAITNIDIFTVGVGPGNLKLQINRRIFNNLDISQSWTVMDIMRVPYSMPLIPPTSVPIGPLKMSLSAMGELALSTVHIRQIMPHEYSKLEDISISQQQMKSAIDQAALDQKAAQKKVSAWEKIKGFFKGDFKSPQIRAHLFKLYNLLTHPFQFPFTQKALIEMPANEIRLYAYEGLLQLSAGFGFDISTVPGVDLLNVGIGPSVYLSGRWQIATLKLPNNRLRIKITRINEQGATFSFGAQHRWDVFKGFVVFGEHIGSISQTLIPFQFTAGKQFAQQFDVGYEFDLNNPEAAKAAHLLLYGQSMKAQQLSRQAQSGVSWLFRRDQNSTTSTRARGVQLEFLYYHNRIAKNQKIDAIVTLPDGEHHYFKGISDATLAWDSLFGGREVTSHSFQVHTDADAFASNDEKSLLVRLSGTIEDARTTGKEMRRYINQVESAIGNDQIFDDYPTHLQKKVCILKKCRMTTKLARYGGSSFHYRITLKRPFVESLIARSEEDMWATLENVYKVKAGKWKTKGKRAAWTALYSPSTLLNLPLALVQVHIKQGDKLLSAQHFMRHWKNLGQYLHDPKKLTFELSELFKTQFFGHERIMILMSLITGHNYDYTLSASNGQLFPYVFKAEHDQQYNDHFMDQLERQLDFESPRYWQRTNPDNVITNIGIEKLSRDKMAISFILRSDPRMLFFSLERKRLLGQKHLDHFVLTPGADGKLSFKQGKNVIILEREEQIEWKARLAKHLFEKGITIMHLSYTNNLAQGWGPLIETRVNWQATNDNLNNK